MYVYFFYLLCRVYLYIYRPYIKYTFLYLHVYVPLYSNNEPDFHRTTVHNDCQLVIKHVVYGMSRAFCDIQKTTIMTEDQIQAALWLRAWNELPQLRHHLWAVPNGLHLSPIHAAKAKSTGLLSGVWDLHCFWRGQLHIIETKRPGQSLTTDRIVNGRKVYGQKEWGERMAAHGAIRHIYHTPDEGFAILKQIIS